MNLLLIRDFCNGKDTLGKLFFKDINKIIRYVYTLEDEYREQIVKGDTRIPAGKYEITLRKEGGVYNSYCVHKNSWIAENTKKYGLLWIRNIPGFEYILIHIGNTEKDTEGCILVGDNANNNSFVNGYISNSTDAYIALLTTVYSAFDKKEKITIVIVDQDKNITEQMKIV
jgi:hypothetical protein